MTDTHWPQPLPMTGRALCGADAPSGEMVLSNDSTIDPTCSGCVLIREFVGSDAWKEAITSWVSGPDMLPCSVCAQKHSKTESRACLTCTAVYCSTHIEDHSCLAVVERLCGPVGAIHASVWKGLGSDHDSLRALCGAPAPPSAIHTLGSFPEPTCTGCLLILAFIRSTERDRISQTLTVHGPSEVPCTAWGCAHLVNPAHPCTLCTSVLCEDHKVDHSCLETVKILYLEWIIGDHATEHARNHFKELLRNHPDGK